MDIQKVKRRIVDYLWKYCPDATVLEIAKLLGVSTDTDTNREEVQRHDE